MQTAFLKNFRRNTNIGDCFGENESERSKLPLLLSWPCPVRHCEGVALGGHPGCFVVLQYLVRPAGQVTVRPSASDASYRRAAPMLSIFSSAAPNPRGLKVTKKKESAGGGGGNGGTSAVQCSWTVPKPTVLVNSAIVGCAP